MPTRSGCVPPRICGKSLGERATTAPAKIRIVRVLLTDGSGLDGAPGRHGAVAVRTPGRGRDARSPPLTRFTRHVAGVHKVPPYGLDPFAWLEAALGVYRDGGFDVLFPTQEQVAVLAAARPPVVTAVPAFEALARVQDKISAHATLASIGLPQPRSLPVRSAADLEGWDNFPAFWKPPIGTATSGIRQVRSRDDLFWDGEPFLLQEHVEGSLVMAQSVFDRGHSSRVRPTCGCGKAQGEAPATSEAPTSLSYGSTSPGSASTSVGTERCPLMSSSGRMARCSSISTPGWSSLPTPGVRAWTSSARSSRWRWVGRPRLNLSAGSMSPRISCFWRCSAQPSRAGVGSGYCEELGQAARHQASYEGSVEELTPIRHDLRAAIPVVAAAAATLAWAAVLAVLLLRSGGELRAQSERLEGDSVPPRRFRIAASPRVVRVRFVRE